jgi:hypothetical protein
MSFIYDYATWDSIKRFIDPNNFDNFVFDYDKEYFYKENNINKTDDGYWVGTVGHYDKSIKEEDKVTYRFNNLFFRSDHFKKIDSNEISILYSGCSWTYGSGMHEDLIWPTILSKKITGASVGVVNSFSVATPGASVFLSIKNVMAFIRNYGKPTYIFMNMPPIARDVRYDKKNNFFYSVIMGNGYFDMGKPNIFIDYIKQHTHEDSILKACEQIKLFEDYCNSSGIKLIWTFWHDADEKIYKDIKFDNIFYPDFNFKRYSLDTPGQEYYPNINTLPLWDLAQDKNHPGSCWNIDCAEKFYNEIVRRENEKNI